MPAHRQNKSRCQAAAVILGLVIHYVHRFCSSSGDSTVFQPLISPFIEALAQAFEGFMEPLPQEIPYRPSSFDFESSFSFYEQLIIRNYGTPLTRFHWFLFEKIAANCVVDSTISLIFSLNYNDKNQTNDSNSIYNFLRSSILSEIKEALNIYIKHHEEYTFGFKKEGKRLKLIPEQDGEVQRKRNEIAHQLFPILFGSTLTNTTEPPVGQTLVAWATGGGRRQTPRGFITPNGHLKNVLFQILLGPSRHRSLEIRDPGTIIQGLIHRYFSAVYGVFTNDATIGYILCPRAPTDRPKILPIPARPFRSIEPMCPDCREPIDFNTHKIVVQRHNIAGKVLEPDDYYDDSGLEDRTVWKVWRLYRCPPFHWEQHLSREAIIDHNTLRQEEHFYPDAPGRYRQWSDCCPSTSILPIVGPTHRIHTFDKPSQRCTRIIFQVQHGIDSSESEGDTQDRLDRDSPDDILYDYLWELVKMNQSNHRGKEVLALLGLTEETFQDNKALAKSSKRILRLLKLWSNTRHDRKQFEKKATDELRNLWENQNMDTNKQLWRSEAEFVESICGQIDLLANIIYNS